MENLYPLQTSVTLEVLLLDQYNFKSNGNYNKEINCSICMETMKNSYVIILPCDHVYHRNCALNNIYTYRRTCCPDPKCNHKFVKV